MDGISFLHEVKLLDPARPVIVLSAYASLKAAVESMGDDVYKFLAKPFQASELLQAVSGALLVGRT